MSDKKKYYWLKLKEDFFEEDTISWLEEQENGKDYCLFYLKLCLKSLKNDGVLIRNVGELFIPYEISKLAEITNTDIDTVIVAMELFKKIGLVQVLENGEIYLTQLKNMIGSETNWAILKRNERQKKLELDNVQKLSTRDRDIEIEKEIEKEQDVFSYFEKSFGRTISPLEVEKLQAWLEVFDEEKIKEAIDQAVLNNKKTYNYVNGILNNWKVNGYEPEWFGKDIQKQELTEEEKREFDELIANF